MNHPDVARAIEAWFAEHRRDLAWRRVGDDGRRDPYRSLVSEFMLQQTQVSRVLEKFTPFLERFPDVNSLAEASEDDVLAAWSGLGYYSRARRLQNAARAIVRDYESRVPEDVESLLSLPGVGRYTAGAMSSIVFGRREPIVDGNVQRVLIRLHGASLQLGTPDTEQWAWEHARSFVEASGDPGAFNEGLMELGATVCTPRGARCEACPVRAHCSAQALGMQEDLPLPKPRAPRRDVWHTLVLIKRDDRLLMHRRPDDGLWAGMWSPPGVERADRAAEGDEVRSALGTGPLTEVVGFVHETTHRRVHFACFRADGSDHSLSEGDGVRWFDAPQCQGLALSNAHRRAISMAFEGSDRG